MPRRRNAQLVVIDENFELPTPQDPIKPVKEYLKNHFDSLYFDTFLRVGSVLVINTIST